MSDLLIGRVFENCKLIKLLGEGGMGAVYQAQNQTIKGLEAAFKMMHPHLARQAEFRQLFFNEAEIITKLNHPNIVKIVNFGEQEDLIYIRMEYIPGEDLRERLRRLRTNNVWLSLSEIILLIQQICRSLHYAHQKGILHRDLKPSNIMLKMKPPELSNTKSLPYDPIIMDFGIAKLKEGLTSTGTEQIRGTKEYMSPEQANPTEREIDRRTDIYSLGVMLFELTTGQHPFPAKTLTEAIKMHCFDPPPDPTSININLPVKVERVIKKALEKDPDKRYQTAEEFANALSELELDDRTELSTPSGTSGVVSLETSFELKTPSGPYIKHNNFDVPQIVDTVLKKMFPGDHYKEISVRRQFNQGRSGAYVIEVRPIKKDITEETIGTITEEHSAIKIADLKIIQNEYLIYGRYVRNVLNKSVNLVEPIIELENPDNALDWGAARYSLVGGGTFEFISLRDYILTTEKEESIRQVQKRLLTTMSNMWTQDYKGGRNKEYFLKEYYNHLLPLDLLIVYQSLVDTPNQSYQLTSQEIWQDFEQGATVHLIKDQFIVVKIDNINHTITLKSPPQAAYIYSLRLKFETNQAMAPLAKKCGIGKPFPETVKGTVKETRESKFLAIAKEIGLASQWHQEIIDLSNTKFHNPYHFYHKIFDKRPDVRFGLVQGDFNLENILIELPGENIYIIDFADTRWDQVLHDFFRYETEIITKIIGEIISTKEIRSQDIPDIIYNFCEHLHQTTFGTKEKDLHSKLPEGLEKPFEILREHREASKSFLPPSLKQDKHILYYQGLVLYLIGALKFKTLNDPKDDREYSIPKQAAFYAAATFIKWAGIDLPVIDQPSPSLIQQIIKILSSRPKLTLSITITICSLLLVLPIIQPQLVSFLTSSKATPVAVISPTTENVITPTAGAADTPEPDETATAIAARETETATSIASTCNSLQMAFIPGAETIAPFCLDIHEVTNAAYRECVDKGPCTPPENIFSQNAESYYDNEEFNNHPVIQVTWTQAATYCESLGKRLPTAAEWDFVADQVQPVDNAKQDDTIAVKTNTQDVTSSDVFTQQIYDLIANVQEWVADDADQSGQKVIKGDSFMPNRENRAAAKIDTKAANLGFRCAIN